MIILDNVDQRPYEFQQESFLVGNAMAASWPATIFISIRPETFYRSRRYGALSAYHPKAFAISPPRLDLVIQKRLEYAIVIIDQGVLRSLADVEIRVDRVKSYMRILLWSFEKRRELVEFCDNMCGGNIRLALEFIKTFIGSGHIDTQKILDIYDDGGRYDVPLHEFARAVIYGDNEYFDARTSVVMNVFDISTRDEKEYFLVCLLLGQIERFGQSRPDGFVEVDAVYRFAQNLGFQADQIGWSLDRCLSRRLLERPARSGGEVSQPSEAWNFYICELQVSTPIMSIALLGSLYTSMQL